MTQCPWPCWGNRGVNHTGTFYHIATRSTVSLSFVSCLSDQSGTGERRRKEGGRGGQSTTRVPGPTHRHHVSQAMGDELQGTAETEERLGHSANQRAWKLQRALPADARQRKWPLWLVNSQSYIGSTQNLNPFSSPNNKWFIHMVFVHQS